jgi:phage-related baseplate assembly protein
MPNYESPALYIDFSRLPPPKVIEDIDYELILQRYRDQVVEKNPALDRAIQLEQSPTNIILEAEAYGEMVLRARVNAAARAVMLAFSTGSDLEHLASLLGVQRGTVPANNSVTPPIPARPESDESLRRRAQMAPEAFTTAGSEGAYIFQSLSAHLGLRDASAIKINNQGGIKVSLMNSGADPTPTDEQIDAVVRRLNAKNIKPLTDVVSVWPVKVKKTDIVANVTMYPGPDAAMVMSDIGVALEKVRNRISLIGRDLTRSAIISAINQEGVQSVDLASPADNIVVGPDECCVITSAAINILPTRTE